MGLLRGVPAVICPDLLLALAQMGHGDEIVLADAHFPAASSARARGATLIDCSGLKIPHLLEGVLKLMPLDTYVYNPVLVMDLVNSDKKKGIKVPIWEKYEALVNEYSGLKAPVEFGRLERFDFYERAQNAFAIVATGEDAIYGNIILKKGHVTPE